MSQPSSNPVIEPSAPPCAVVAADQEKWFKEEIHAHEGQLKSWLRSSFPRVRDVEDVVQESYLRIWKARMVEMAEPIASAKAYLFTVARRLALNVLQREQRSPITRLRGLDESAVLDDRAGVADSISRQEKFELLTDAVAKLCGTREILLLSKFDGITQAEIARRLRLSEKSVQYHVRRAIDFCTAYFHAQGHDFF